VYAKDYSASFAGIKSFVTWKKFSAKPSICFVVVSCSLFGLLWITCNYKLVFDVVDPD
jgi:hypothetical protein